MTRSLAVELGPLGARVVCVRSMGMAETRTMQQTYELGGKAMGVPKEKMAEIITSKALLRRSPSLVDTAKLVSFLASDEAGSITGAIVNSSSGQVLDWTPPYGEGVSPGHVRTRSSRPPFGLQR